VYANSVGDTHALTDSKNINMKDLKFSVLTLNFYYVQPQHNDIVQGIYSVLRPFGTITRSHTGSAVYNISPRYFCDPISMLSVCFTIFVVEVYRTFASGNILLASLFYKELRHTIRKWLRK